MSENRTRIGDEHLDSVIDHVARQMTDGAPPADLRARVLARLTTNPESRFPSPVPARWIWTLAPIGGAALIVVAVFVAHDRGPRNDGGSQRAAQLHAAPPIDRAPSTTTPESSRADNTLVAKRSHPPSPHGGFGETGRPRSADVPRADSAAVAEIDALSPSPIEASSIDVDAMTTESIAIPPLETVAPVPVAPLATPEGERP